MVCDRHEPAYDYESELQAYLDAHECGECGAEGSAVSLVGPYTRGQERLGLVVQCTDCGDVGCLGDGYANDDHATQRAESGYAQ